MHGLNRLRKSCCWVGPGFSPDTHLNTHWPSGPGVRLFSRSISENSGRAIPQGLKAKERCLLMSGLKPGPAQTVTFSPACVAHALHSKA